MSTASHTILIVDDEVGVRKLTTAYLTEAGFRVYSAETGNQGLAMFRRYQPILVILDIMLPEVDGWEILKQIRHESETYVIMLTAKSEEVDRVLGLTIGADDYVSKPYSPSELVARVKAVLRRGKPSGENAVLHYRHIRIDSGRHEVWVEYTKIDLTAIEFKLLKLLASYPEMVFSRSQIIEHVWGRDFYGEERIVNLHIANIRRKLEHPPGTHQFILTVRGVGYKFRDERL